LLTADILDLLKDRLPADAFALLGITMVDFIPQWNFVFGQASLRDRVGVYSFARYAPQSYERIRRRERAGDVAAELQGPGPRNRPHVRDRALHLVALPDERIEPPCGI
jgi:archaemetzincin